MYNKATINQVADVVRKILDYREPPYDPVDAVNKLKGIIDNEVADVAIDASIERCKTNGKEFIIHLNKIAENRCAVFFVKKRKQMTALLPATYCIKNGKHRVMK